MRHEKNLRRLQYRVKGCLPARPNALHSVLKFFVSINALEVRVTNLPSRNCEPPRLDRAAATALPALCEEGIQWDWEEVRGILPSTFKFTRNLFPIQKRFSVESSQSSTNSRLLSLSLFLSLYSQFTAFCWCPLHSRWGGKISAASRD